MEIFDAEFKRIMQCLIETHKLVSSLGTEENDTKMYLEMGAEVCGIRQKFIEKSKIYEAAEKEVTLEGYDKALERGLNMPQKEFDPKNTIEYKEFYAQITADEENVEEDGDMVVKVELNKFDPITKKKMVNPVKSTVCGHHYEKETIYMIMKHLANKNKKCKCPVAGCINNSIEVNQLEDDPVFKAQIQSDDDED